MFLVGRFIIKPLTIFFREKHLSHLIPTFAIGMTLFYFSGAEIIGGLAGITGAYFAGLFHRMGDEKHSAEKVISPYVNVFLLPLFLGIVGMQVNLQILSFKDWIIVFSLLLLAIITKLGGCFLSTFIYNIFSRNKWSFLESYLFGSSMIARGEVGLVIATILKGSNIINTEQFMIAISTIVLTTIATPIMLGIGFDILNRKTKIKEETKTLAIQIGPFKHLSPRQIFNIINTTIHIPAKAHSVVQLSEGRRILTLSKKLKVILAPDAEGITVEGTKYQVKELLEALNKALKEDFSIIPKDIDHLKNSIPQ